MEQHPTLPLKQIRPGHNPRKYFDPAAMAEMVESVRKVGVIQPIIVRPSDDGDGFIVVAGERRYRAALEAHGEAFEMPVVVRYIDAAEAKILALVENVQCDDMALSEEAASAADAVGICKGDRDEAAKFIGWDRSKLDSRLALMNCSPAVLDALNTRSIKLGHAELLAALAKEKQDALLPVIISERKTVLELKKVISSAACVLASAIFDKTECAACPHNSSIQTEMFGESIGTGHCTNRACFNEKTDKQLEATAAALRDEFPVVRILRAGDNHTRIQLVVDGPKGVGEEQAKACHACQSFGVAVSGLPDSVGKVYRGQCFDTLCNMKKVAAHLKAETPSVAPKANAADKGVSAPAATKAPKRGEGYEPTVVAESDRVKAYRVALWRKALRRDIALNHDLAREFLIGIVLAGNARQIDDNGYRGMFERLTKVKLPVSDLEQSLTMVRQVDAQGQTNLMLAMLYAAIDGIDVQSLKKLCLHHGLDLKKHWALDKALLELITKSEMTVIADEIGLRAALGDNFKKIFTKSKGEVIDALLAVEGFDYAATIPKILQF